MKPWRSSYYKEMQKLADRYLADTGKDVATTKEFAVWAIQSGNWDPPRDLILHACQEDFAKALREQYIEDDHGKPVRAKHSARVKKDGEQLYLWADIRRAPRGHMEIAFQQRRQQIVGDCRQLKRDVDYYNSRPGEAEPIQLVFDFTEDVEEGEYSSEFQVA